MKALVVCYRKDFGTRKVVMNSLEKADVDAVCIDRDLLSADKFMGRDFVVTVGGDGTFLRAAQFTGNQLILSVTVNRKLNEGFFARASGDDFMEKLKLILKGKYRVIPLNRIVAEIADRKKKSVTEPAVNELYAGSRSGYLTSRYILKIGNISEFQKSSGVLVSTAAGSHAWIRSAGGLKMDMRSMELQYKVREPYFGRHTNPELLGGILPESCSVVINAQFRDGVVVADSRRNEHSFGEGAVITIKSANKPLMFIDV